MRMFSCQPTSNRPRNRQKSRPLRSHRPPRRRGQGHPRPRLPPGIARSRCRSSAIKAIPLRRAPVIRPARPSSLSRLIALGRFWQAASFARPALRRLIRKRSTRCGARSHSRRHPRTCPVKPSISPCQYGSIFDRRRTVKSTTMLVSALIFCAVAPIYAEAKTDHSQCEERCRQFNCSGGMNRQLYCSSECHRKCVRQEDRESSDHAKKQN